MRPQFGLTPSSGGLPPTQIVGLPEAALRESRDLVRAALVCAQFDYPQRRILISLAPADLPKEGGRFALAIALGIHAASDQIDRHLLADYESLAELALTGELSGVDGALPAAIAAAGLGRTLVIAASNGAEAALRDTSLASLGTFHERHGELRLLAGQGGVRAEREKCMYAMLGKDHLDALSAVAVKHTSRFERRRATPQ